MKKLAIITARGGSKRIPRKNIKTFVSKPIIAYSVEAALGSGVFDEVMVSTDDEEISSIAKEYGANVPFLRSEATSNDYATTADVITEVLGEYEKRGLHFDIACCIYPTAPFITPARLKESVLKLEESDADTLIPVVGFSYPPQRALVIENDRLEFKYPEYLSARSQDLVKHYHDAGQFYVFKTDAFSVNKNLMVGNIIPMILDEMEVQDIDTLQDWELAELKYEMLHRKK